MAWVLDYLPALRSDFSRFHRIRKPLESLPAFRFIEYAEHITAYEGAVTAVNRKAEEVRKSRMAVPSAIKQNPQVQEVPAHAALASINDGRKF